MPLPALSAFVARSRSAQPTLTDGQLLDRFISAGDEAAFAELVRRHGPFVLAVCRRTVGDHHRAEDAFQATFLVLARKATAVRPREGVRAFLYGIAVRVAREARTVSARHNARESPVAALPERAADRQEPPDADSLRALDEEVAALPEHLRAAVVLCELDGLSRKDAAVRLKIPEGTLSSRLAKARTVLAGRLRRRGVALPAAGLGVLAGSAPVSARLAASAAAFASPGAAVPAAVATLSTGVLRMMFALKLRAALALATAAVGSVACAVLAAGPGSIVPAPQATPVSAHRPDDPPPKVKGPEKTGDGKGGDAAKDGGAEKLYRAMENKVRGAKSLHVALNGEVDSDAVKGTIKATISVAEGNKSRIEMEADIGGKAEKLLLMTDGKVMYTKQGDKGTLDPNPKKAEASLKLLPGAIARIGFTGTRMVSTSKPDEEKDLDKQAPVSNFKFGPKEKVGDRAAQVVTYRLDLSGTSAQMSVWIDTTTQMPLKRVLSVTEGDKSFRMSETYRTFEIDPKLEPRLFDVPKE
ncbi:MAG: RNA polymerase sigma factor [Isosphaeraceae bacterium]